MAAHEFDPQLAEEARAKMDAVLACRHTFVLTYGNLRACGSNDPWHRSRHCVCRCSQCGLSAGAEMRIENPAHH